MKQKSTAFLGLLVLVFALVFFETILYFIPSLSLDHSSTYIVYFQGSLGGLAVGSPVNYRGIRVGQVVRMEMEYNVNSRQFDIPIFIRFYKDLGGELANNTLIDKLIKQGLRADLRQQSLLAGNAVINIELHSNRPGYVINDPKFNYTIIPSIPDEDQPADLNAAIDAAKNMFESFTALAKSERVKNAIHAFRNAADSVSTLSNTINEQTPGVADNFNRSMNELNQTAYSIRSLSDYLNRHPEALIKGRN